MTNLPTPQTLLLSQSDKPQSLPTETGRLVIVSNREPFTIEREGQEIRLEKTPGGLVSALDPVLRNRGGLWICWEGATKKWDEFDDISMLENGLDWDQVDIPYELQTVSLSEEEINHYYYGYANTRLWPLFHYFVSHCDFFDDRDWPSYVSANQKFAQAVLENTTDEDWVWVQDYHLLLVPEMVRDKAPGRKLALFSHIPFPTFEVFRILPRGDKILRGMLGSDLIGFHIPEYVDYFIECVDKLLVDEEMWVDRDNRQIHYHGRVVQVDAFPISIDFAQIRHLAESSEMKQARDQLRESYQVPMIGIGVDRLDYSKGILEKLEALRVFFEKYPEYQKQVTFIQIAAPTRTEVAAYRKMKEDIDQAVGRINGALARDNWVPIHYFYRSFSLEEIVPYFMMADFALVTPLRDGMNLVAKEYCAAKLDNSGALILSEMVGAASRMREAFLVNPFFVEGVADKLSAVLRLSETFKMDRMKKLRQIIETHDIHNWVQTFLQAFERAVDVN